MARFDPSEYETVDSRLHRFWDAHPEGRVLTALEEPGPDRFIVYAQVFRNAEDERPAATGYAEEVVGSNPVNKTAALENCETSAIGRALANLGMSPKGSRPSETEMGKAARMGKRSVLDAAAGDRRLAKSLWSDAASNHGYGADDQMPPDVVEQVVGEAVRAAGEQLKLIREKP